MPLNPSYKLFPDEHLTRVCETIVSKVTINPNGCWVWNGPRMKVGYGTIKVNGKKLYMHRVSSYLFHSSFDPLLHVLHDCPYEHDKACISPWHLKQGTQAENMSHPLTRNAIANGVLDSIARRKDHL